MWGCLIAWIASSVQNPRTDTLRSQHAARFALRLLALAAHDPFRDLRGLQFSFTTLRVPHYEVSVFVLIFG